MAEETTRQASIQLASVPEETTSSFAGLTEETTRQASIQLASVPEETTSSFAGLAEDTTRLASIQLASVPEETTSSFVGLLAPYPPPQSYRESIRSVAWWRPLSSLSGQSGSNYSSISGTSGSYLSNISGYSVGSASAGTLDFGTDELTKIAHTMISDGYTQRMVQSFKYCGEQDSARETWFTDLDINWVLQMRENYDFDWLYKLQEASASFLQELAERWVRALTIIIVSIKLLVGDVHEMLAVARFGEASISAMLVFVDNIVRVSNTEKLPAMLHLYICVSNASYDMSTMQMLSSDVQTIINEIGHLLESKGDDLIGSMSTTMSGVKWTLMKDKDTQRLVWREGRYVVETTKEDLWAIEITQGQGEVHKNTRLMVDYIVLMRKAQASAHNSAQSDNSRTLCDLIDDSISYLKDLLLRKSELCPDPSLRYLFLLNNSCYVAQVVSEPSISLDVELWPGHQQGLELTPECADYMDRYIKVSWEDVLSWLSLSKFQGPLRRWINTSSLAKFQSAFHKTYQAQKFWKVPDPRLRDALRRAITERAISGYRYYLKENPELEKQVSSGSNSPEILEEMLGELFEG